MTRRLGCALLIAYPLVEVTIAVLVAQVIGWWWLLVIVVMCIVLGLGLVRYALGATGRSFGMAIATLQGPGDQGVLAIEGVGSAPTPAPPAQTLLIVPAGLLIAVPGLLTTAVGLVLWLPFVRSRIAARIERAARRLGPPEGMGGFA